MKTFSLIWFIASILLCFFVGDNPLIAMLEILNLVLSALTFNRYNNEYINK